MIVLDTSALIAIVGDEPEADACQAFIAAADRIAMSAANLAECLIVARRHDLAAEVEALVAGIGCEVVPVTHGDARAAAEAYRRWGKGNDPAKLNFGDCFAYALAKRLGCPLVFKGDDFAKTDIEPLQAIVNG